MENEESLRAVRKELKLTKLCCVFSMLLTLCMAVVIGYICMQLQPVFEMADTIEPVLEEIDEVRPALEQLSEVDTEELNTLLEEAGPVLEQLSEIDADAINEMLASYDPEEFQEALDNLNTALETVNSFSDKLGSLGSWFK